MTATLPIRGVERNPDDSWRVEVGPDGHYAEPASVLIYLHHIGARRAHLTGPGVHAVPEHVLIGLKAPWLHWNVHVPSHVYDPVWWRLADEITAHAVPGEPVAARWQFDRARNRPVAFSHTPLV